MRKNEINKRFSEIAKIRQNIKKAQTELEKLESEVKEYMTLKGITELIGDEHTATFKPTKSFDEETFKGDMPELFKEYATLKLDVTALKRAVPEIHAEYSVEGESKRFNFA